MTTIFKQLSQKRICRKLKLKKLQNNPITSTVSNMLVIRIATKNEYIYFETIQPEATPILNFVQQNTFVDKPNENRMKQYAVLFP